MIVSCYSFVLCGFQLSSLLVAWSREVWRWWVCVYVNWLGFVTQSLLDANRHGFIMNHIGLIAVTSSYDCNNNNTDIDQIVARFQAKPMRRASSRDKEHNRSRSYRTAATTRKTFGGFIVFINNWCILLSMRNVVIVVWPRDLGLLCASIAKALKYNYVLHISLFKQFAVCAEEDVETWMIGAPQVHGCVYIVYF